MLWYVVVWCDIMWRPDLSILLVGRMNERSCVGGWEGVECAFRMEMLSFDGNRPLIVEILCNEGFVFNNGWAAVRCDG